MNKNYVGTVIVVVIIIILVIVFASKSKETTPPLETVTPTPTATSTSPTPTVTGTTSPTVSPLAKVIVTYTASGFSPSTISVKKGQTVEFQNKTSSDMSVASDPHPTHTIYPEFDQYKTSYRGQSTFPFTFDKVGNWGYHNHLQSSHKGTIIVTN